MEKKDLDRALNRGILVMFNTAKEKRKFLRKIKSFGGKWFNGEEITEADYKCSNKTASPILVDKDYLIGKVSAMCMHFGAFPTVWYKKFASDKFVIDVN